MYWLDCGGGSVESIKTSRYNISIEQNISRSKECFEVEEDHSGSTTIFSSLESTASETLTFIQIKTTPKEAEKSLGMMPETFQGENSQILSTSFIWQD